LAKNKFSGFQKDLSQGNLAFVFSFIRMLIPKPKEQVEAMESLPKERQILTFSTFQFSNWLPLNNQNLHSP
jgi:hypothetical protein